MRKRAKLNAEQIRAIRDYPESVQNKPIGVQFGISEAHVSKIRNRRQWKKL